MTKDIIAPCGLYCSVCLDNLIHHECHGCGCDCGRCAGQAHFKGCSISQCADQKGYETCAECKELPCTNLIQFAYAPCAPHHLPVIETLRRVKKIGKEAALAELQTYFRDEDKKYQWAFLEDLGGRRWKEFQAWKALRVDKT